MNAAAPEPLLVCAITKGWKRFYALTFWTCALICAGGPLAWLLIQPGSPAWQIPTLVIGCSLAALSVAAARRVDRYQLLLYADRLRRQTIWKHQDILLADLEGFRFVPNTPPGLVLKRRGSIRFHQLELVHQRRGEFLVWLTSRLPNLDEQQAAAELAEIKANEHLGLSEDQRLRKLATTRKWSRLLNAVGIGALVWGIFFPRPYGLVLGLLVVLPFVSLLLVTFFPNTLRLDGPPRSAYPNVAGSFLMPPLALMLRAVIDWEILEYAKVWPPVLIGSVVLIACAALASRELRKNKTLLMLMSLFLVLHAYGTVLFVNGFFDRSIPFRYECPIVHRHVSTGKHTSHHFELSPFIDGIPHRDVRVPKHIYQKYHVGASAHVFVHEGYLEIPWLYVR